jgi:acyl-CoA thioesterase I
MAAMRAHSLRLAIAGLLFLAACRSEEPPPCESGPEVKREAVMFLGTSLTAGYGISPSDAFPALLGDRMEVLGLPFYAVNAGVPGETSAAARGLLPWLLEQDFSVLVLESGANDMLQRLGPEGMKRNLREIVRQVRTGRPDAEIVLLGVGGIRWLPSSMMRAYERAFKELAEEEGVSFAPRLLDGVLLRAARNLPDRVHPNEAGHRVIAETVWKTLGPVLHRQCARAS